MKSAVFERQQGNIDIALNLLEDGLKSYPKYGKLYMIKGQILQTQKKYDEARATFAAGTKACPKEIPLWILASRLEEEAGRRVMARSILNKARVLNQHEPLLWMESVQLEERDGAMPQAKVLLSKGSFLSIVCRPAIDRKLCSGLQDCPTSGILWSITILSEARPQRRTRSVDAMKKAGDDPYIICTVARLFWAERKVEKARHWFSRAVSITAGKDLGDIWAWWYKFELEHGTSEQRQAIIDQCTAAEPRHGTVWPATAKDLVNAGKSIPEILVLVAKELH